MSAGKINEMFSVREVPWHGEGHVLEDYPQSWEEARILAGLDWDPISAPVYSLAGINEDGTDRYEQIPGFQAVNRSDNGATLALAKSSYALITNSAFGEIFEAVLQQTNVKAETGGCMEDGRAVYMLCKLDEPIVIPGDKTMTMPYLALTSRHDADGATVLRATGVRIVCMNTFRAAELEGERSGATFKFVHRGDWKDRIEEARAAVTGARKELADYAQLAADLLAVKVPEVGRERFVTEFIPAPPAGMASARVLTNVDNSRAKLRQILTSETVEGAGISGTAYGLVQAAGEYLDHVRTSRSWETRVNRTLLRPEPLKAKAMKLALECANA